MLASVLYLIGVYLTNTRELNIKVLQSRTARWYVEVGDRTGPLHFHENAETYNPRQDHLLGSETRTPSPGRYDEGEKHIDERDTPEARSA